MIYADQYAEKDTDDCPAERGSDLCLNCGYNWGSHNNWCCPRSVYWGKHFTFQTLPADHRYLTQGMQDSFGVVGNIVVGSVKVIYSNDDDQDMMEDLTDSAESPCRKGTCSHEGCARVSRPSPRDYGERCTCGITPANCDYHSGKP